MRYKKKHKREMMRRKTLSQLKMLTDADRIQERPRSKYHNHYHRYLNNHTSGGDAATTTIEAVTGIYDTKSS